jgi:hypothetical protein
MALTELERKAVQELERELGGRIEREHKLESWSQVYPEDIARHEAEIARLKKQLERLRAYASS